MPQRRRQQANERVTVSAFEGRVPRIQRRRLANHAAEAGEAARRPVEANNRWSSLTSPRYLSIGMHVRKSRWHANVSRRGAYRFRSEIGDYSSAE